MASFDENGKYIKTNWKAGDKITATKLNKIEESIEAVNDNDISRHVEADARLDALEAKDVAHDKEFTNVKNLIADNKAAAELGDYEINSRMQFLEDELEEAVAEVNNVASTVDGKIAAAETNMQNQVNQGKADMEAMVAEVEADLEGLHAKDEKLSAQLEHIKNEGVNVKEFGAKGDGVTDDTTAIQNSINYASQNNLGVIIPSGIYNVDRIELYNGLAFLRGDSNTILNCISNTLFEGLIELGGEIFNRDILDNCLIENLTLKLNSKVKYGIFGSCVNSYIKSVRVKEVMLPSKGGIRLHFDSKFNTIDSCTVKMQLDNPMGTIDSMAGIQLSSEVVDETGGLRTNGAFSSPTKVCEYNKIINNHIEGGTHGVSLYGAVNNFVNNNTIIRASHRCIIASPVASKNTITQNKMYEFNSAGILLNLGSSHCIVANNFCQSLNPWHPIEVGIGVQLFCGNTIVSNNYVEVTNMNYNLNIGPGSSNCQVIGNNLQGSPRHAYIAVQSNWIDPARYKEIGLKFGKTNYNPPPETISNWANDIDLIMVNISNNTIYNNDRSKDNCAIIFEALDKVKIVSCNITNNTIFKPNGAVISVFNMTDTEIQNLKISDNTIYYNDNGDRILFTNPNMYIMFPQPSYYSNNSWQNLIKAISLSNDTNNILDVSVFKFVSVESSEASVSGSNFKEITNFENGIPNEEIKIRVLNKVRIKNGSNIRTKSKADIEGDGNIYTFKLLDKTGIWFEV